MGMAFPFPIMESFFLLFGQSTASFGISVSPLTVKYLFAMNSQLALVQPLRHLRLAGPGLTGTFALESSLPTPISGIEMSCSHSSSDR